MDGGLLSLKWNNHRSTFFYVLSNVRKKECYTDVTLACDGKFYKVHKLVLSTCSDYFEQMFEETQCKHPVIVLKDIRSEELESLLSYMYVGEVNVVQEKLSGLIKAAECLRIKGLAVPDEEPVSSNNKQSSGGSREKRTSDNNISSEPKRRRQDDSRQSSRSEERRKSFDSSNKLRNSNVISNSTRGDISSEGTQSSREPRLSSPPNHSQNVPDVKMEEPVEELQPDPPAEVTIDEPSEPVKEEPVDLDAVYLSDSNSASESKDILMENFGDGDGQQHFMDELLGQNSASDQGHMVGGDYGDGGEGGSAGGSQQPMEQPRLLPLLASLHDTEFQQQLSSTSLTTSSILRPNVYEQFGAMHVAAAGRHSLIQDRQQHSSTASTQRLQHTQQMFATNSDQYQRQDQHHDLVPFDELPRLTPSDTRMNFKCPVCGKEFYNKKDFRRHYMVHTGERPFSCPYCPHSANRQDSLKTHISLKHTGLPTVIGRPKQK